MNYGLYLSASGVLTNSHRQDVIANNLANASTVGFKRDLAAFTQRLPESQRTGADPTSSNQLLDRLGGGVFVAPTQLDARDGSYTQSGNELDLAIKGDGFFAVWAADTDGRPATRLTRDGQFTLDEGGRLITTVGGHAVLDRGGREITINRALPVTVDTAGRVKQAGSVVAELKLVNAQDDKALRHLGHGLYTANDATLNSDAQAPGRVLQQWVETSNVDSVKEMVAMIEATRAVTNNATMIRYHDSIMERAVNVLGRVA